MSYPGQESEENLTAGFLLLWIILLIILTQVL